MTNETRRTGTETPTFVMSPRFKFGVLGVRREPNEAVEPVLITILPDDDNARRDYIANVGAFTHRGTGEDVELAVLDGDKEAEALLTQVYAVIRRERPDFLEQPPLSVVAWEDV